MSWAWLAASSVSTCSQTADRNEPGLLALASSELAWPAASSKGFKLPNHPHLQRQVSPSIGPDEQPIPTQSSSFV